MKLLPRRNATAVPETVEDLPDDPDEATPAQTPGKGRPTPKRRESTVVRGPVTAPKTRKEAYARQKQQTRSGRQARRSSSSSSGSTAGSSSMTAAQRREALRAGDPAMLPRRDQGPTRKLARDYVDSHRLFSNYLLFLFPLMIASYALPNLSLIVIVIFFGLIAEWNIVGRRVRKMAMERFGKAEGSAMGIGFYAGSRAYLPRRWRLPAPQVERGEKI